MRQCEIEVQLDIGEYIILPRTTGCTLRPMFKGEPVKLFHKDPNSPLNYSLNPYFEVVLQDIFNKYDMMSNKVLGYDEFKVFCQCIGRNISSNTFEEEYLTKF